MLALLSYFIILIVSIAGIDHVAFFSREKRIHKARYRKSKKMNSSLWYVRCCQAMQIPTSLHGKVKEKSLTSPH